VSVGIIVTARVCRRQRNVPAPKGIALSQRRDGAAVKHEAHGARPPCGNWVAAMRFDGASLTVPSAILTGIRVPSTTAGASGSARTASST
jgi:hypothetical protein